MCLPVIYLFLVSCFAIRGQNVNSTTTLSKTAAAELPSRTFTPKIIVNAEGGSVTTDALSFKIPNDIGNPSDSKKNSHVQPRKEAKLPETAVFESSDKELNILPKGINNTLKPSQLAIVHHNSTYMSSESTKNLQQNSNLSKSAGEEKVNKPPEHIPKPTMTSYDALNNVPSSIIKSNKLQDLKSSSIPIDSDQIPSPNQEVPNKSFYSNIAARSPSMMIPIAISLLVLPVVALLGYVGLRKGKEAWKNRHYKRMDFLLDGMYNE